MFASAGSKSISGGASTSESGGLTRENSQEPALDGHQARNLCLVSASTQRREGGRTVGRLSSPCVPFRGDKLRGRHVTVCAVAHRSSCHKTTVEVLADAAKENSLFGATRPLFCGGPSGGRPPPLEGGPRPRTPSFQLPYPHHHHQRRHRPPTKTAAVTTRGLAPASCVFALARSHLRRHRVKRRAAFREVLCSGPIGSVPMRKGLGILIRNSSF